MHHSLATHWHGIVTIIVLIGGAVAPGWFMSNRR